MDCLADCRWKSHHLDSCSTDECLGCRPRQRAEKSNLCEVCGLRLQTNLGQIVELWPDFRSQLGNSTQFAMTERVSGSHEPGLVLNDIVIERETEVRDWLLFVVRVIITENNYPGEVSRSTFGLAKFATLHVPFLLGHELAADFLEDSNRHHFKLRSVAYPVKKFKANLDQSCAQLLPSGEVCGGQLFAQLRSDMETLPKFVVCKSDRSHLIPIGEWKNYPRLVYGALAQD